VAVALRAGSPTYGRWEGVELDAESGRQAHIPVGYAHGFLTLEPDTEVIYKVSDYYAAQSEGGIAWDDSDIGIDWPLPESTMPVISEKDARLLTLDAFQSPFAYDGMPFIMQKISI
jgi:dTDP-4-dehydrorhamnose 3,5-epimerase